MIRTLFQPCLRSVFVAAGVLLTASSSFAATSLSQFGITWTFDRDYPTGQFANGDYWVVGPVKIVSITPKSTTSSGRTINGSMVNPVVGKTQGYDSATYGSGGYSATLNVGLGVSASSPLTLNAGSSLISSISNSTAGMRPQLKAAAVLTVLSQAAPAGSFRPPYVGRDKTLRWNKSQLKFSLLRSLPKVADTPALSTVEAYFARPWIEQYTDWQGGYLHPSENQPHYGRDMANRLAEGLLSLHLDYTAAQKEKLLIRLVQYGIDVYGAAVNGAVWVDDGGHNQGRKLPLLLAGMVLGDANILARANATQHFIFQEDRQTWYVTNADVGRTVYTGDGRPRLTYTSAHVGLAEWGEKHTSYPARDGSNWNAYYRDVVGHSILGHALAARLLQAEGYWKWPAFFDYADRYWNIEKAELTGAGNAIRPFVHAMWRAYRQATPSTFTPDTTATEVWNSSAFTAQTGSFTVAWDSVPSQSKMDGVTGLSLGVPTKAEDLAAIVRFAPTGFIDVRNGSAYGASATVSYTAGVSYRFVMTVNLSTRRYSVTVTPKGGSTVQLARDFAFRTEQATATKLDRIGFCAATGAHSVTNVAVQATTSTTTTTTPPPATSTSLSAAAGSWASTPFTGQTGKFTLAFDVVPSTSSLTAEVGSSLGSADAVEDLATLIRFTSSGTIEARNSGLYAATQVMTYRGGTTYRVVMTVDLSTHRYDMTVTPAGGAAVKLASYYAFRNTQKYVTKLDRLSLTATGGTVSVSNVALNGQTSTATSTSSTSTTSTTTTATATTTTSPTSTSGTTLTATAGKWVSQSYAGKTGAFTLAFTVTPSANGIEAEVGSSLGAADAVEDLATLVRFTTSGTIEARNSGLYMAAPPLTYRAGIAYRVVMTINVSTRRYDMTVTPAGGKSVKIASNYAFRNTQRYVSKLDRLSATTRSGTVTVSAISVQ